MRAGSRFRPSGPAVLSQAPADAIGTGPQPHLLGFDQFEEVPFRRGIGSAAPRVDSAARPSDVFVERLAERGEVHVVTEGDDRTVAFDADDRDPDLLEEVDEVC